MLRGSERVVSHPPQTEVVGSTPTRSAPILKWCKGSTEDFEPFDPRPNRGLRTNRKYADVVEWQTREP